MKCKWWNWPEQVVCHGPSPHPQADFGKRASWTQHWWWGDTCTGSSTSLAHGPETTHTCLNTQHHWLMPWNNPHLSQHDQHTTSLAHAPETTHTCLNMINTQHHWLRPLKQHTLVSTWPTHNITGSCSWNNTHLSQHDQHTSLAHAPETTHTCLNMINTQHHWLMPLKQHTLVSTWPTQAGLGKRVGHSTNSGVTPALGVLNITGLCHWIVKLPTLVSTWSTHNITGSCPLKQHTCLSMINTQHHWLVPLKQHTLVSTHITGSFPWNNTFVSK